MCGSVKETTDFSWRHKDMSGNRHVTTDPAMSGAGYHSGPGKKRLLALGNVLVCIVPNPQIGKPS